MVAAQVRGYSELPTGHCRIAQCPAKILAGTAGRGKFCAQTFTLIFGEKAMNMRDLIPWARNQNSVPEFFRDERMNPFLTLRRELDRLLDEASRGFASSPFPERRSDFVSPAWPKLEVADTEKQITVSGEFPGMDEKDVELLLNDGNLVIRGEVKSETEDKERRFSERFHGRFERQIQVGADIEEDKVEAWFNSGVLKVTLPKTGRARTQAKRIAINIPTKH